MKLTKSQLIQNINEELSSDEIQQILNYMEPIFSGINSNRKIMDKNVQILQAKINKVDETGLLRLRHYEQTGEVMVQPFREPEGTGELGELPPDAGDTMRDPGDTRSLGPDAPEDELNPKFMPTEGKTIKLTKSQFKQVIEEELGLILKEHAKNYVWGVKGPGRVANQYSLRPFHSTEK